MTAVPTRCPTCARLLVENEELTNEVSGLLSTTRRQARELVALRTELNRRAEQTPRAQEIRRVAEHWLRLHPRARCPSGGKRWRTVDAALKLGHEPEELLEALDGLAARPFVTETGRSATGTPAQRYDDLTHALRDEVTIERFRGYARNARLKSSLGTDPGADPYWAHVGALDPGLGVAT